MQHHTKQIKPLICYSGESLPKIGCWARFEFREVVEGRLVCDKAYVNFGGRTDHVEDGL